MFVYVLTVKPSKLQLRPLALTLAAAKIFSLTFRVVFIYCVRQKSWLAVQLAESHGAIFCHGLLYYSANSMRHIFQTFHRKSFTSTKISYLSCNLAYCLTMSITPFLILFTLHSDPEPSAIKKNYSVNFMIKLIIIITFTASVIPRKFDSVISNRF